jgi:mannose-1-phosphate guanylyltransferase
MATQHNHALILAGGRGTRFWPHSRKRSAKQVLKFFGDRSLIQQTVDRLRPMFAPERMWVLTNEHVRDEIVKQLPEIPKAQIFAEPAQRNTASILGLAAHMLRSIDPDAVMAVFSADQLIDKPGRYRALLKPALRAAAQGDIAVLGIQPRWPETGFGYIEFPKGVEAGALKTWPVLKFREKPDQKTAERFVKQGRFYWNAGMFFWRADVLLDALRRHLPKTATLLASLPAWGSRKFAARVRETFPLCENISVDYAVLEKAGNVVGVAGDDIGWNDVGSWNAVYELLPRDAGGNVVRSDAILEAATGNYVHAPGKMVALVGVRNLVVVDTPDALLIVDRDLSQHVGKIVKKLELAQRDDLL